MRQLYVCSKPFPYKDNELHPRLIGILSEIKPGTSPQNNGEYQFEYKLGDSFPEHIVRLNDFPYVNKVYKGKELSNFLKKWLPNQDSIWLKDVLKRAKTSLENYDEWAILKALGDGDSQDHAYLYETLPEGVVCYEN
jgi:hypothetical protein